jgi:hypothetical protein
MKKIALLAACVTLLVFGSCDNSQNGKEDTKETTVTASPDLTFWELKGPVKSCDEVEFDRQGMIAQYLGYDPFAIEEPYREIDEEGYMEEFSKWERDQEGQISTVTGIEGMTTYTWHDGLMVHNEGVQEATEFAADYEYDENGLLVKLYEYMREASDEEKESEMPLWSTTEYHYLEFDSHGNWIRREVSVVYADYDTTEDYEETRTIAYYE